MRPETFVLMPSPGPAASRTEGHGYRLSRADASEARLIGRLPLEYCRWPGNFVGIVEVAAAALRELPASASHRAQAMAMTIAIARWLGPGRHYWPNAQDIRIAARDWRIYHEEFDGRNTAALAAKYRMTPRGMTMILARQRKFEIAVRKRRMDLADPG